MNVGDVGEFRLIQMLDDLLSSRGRGRAHPGAAHGFRIRVSIGDDGAVWEGPGGSRVITTDTMVDGVHFRRGAIGWRDLGWKVLAVNLSDVAAMGCMPLYAVVTLGLQPELPVDAILDAYHGMQDACERYGVAVVGGDIVRSPVLFLTVAMVGAAAASGAGREGSAAVLTRSGATPGDEVAVTGHVGCSAAGLRLLTQGPTADAEATGHLTEAHVRPTPRVREGLALARLGASAAIDVSDGLVADLAKLCDASRVAAVVHAARVPADAFLRRAFPADWLDLALGGGEDYELLFSAAPAAMARIATELETPVAVIGEVRQGPAGVALLDEAGRASPLRSRGWDHFRAGAIGGP